MGRGEEVSDRSSAGAGEWEEDSRSPITVSSEASSMMESSLLRSSQSCAACRSAGVGESTRRMKDVDSVVGCSSTFTNSGSP